MTCSPQVFIVAGRRLLCKHRPCQSRVTNHAIEMENNMNISCAKLIYFSPTGTTKKVLGGIATGLDLEIAEFYDLTRKNKKADMIEMRSDDLAIIGSPVYGGRIPPLATERIREFKAKQTPAVLVVVYGNRAYEDALLELCDITEQSGFHAIAGAAFIGEHSLSSSRMPIGHGRPDSDDLEKARLFGEKIRQKITTLNALETIPSFEMPGNHPYKDVRKREPISPVTHEEFCIKCGQCVEVCPTSAVTIGDTVITNSNTCIVCCACIKNCPTEARRLENPGMLKFAKWLYATCSSRKEPEIFGV